MKDDSARITLNAEVSPSEDPEKVLQAARNVLGECNYSVQKNEGSVVLRSSGLRCLQKVHDQLRDRHVRDAARRILLRSVDGDTLRILFNRQAAFVGVIATVSSAEESPLGPLVLELVTRDPQGVIDWLTLYQTVEPQSQARP